MASNKAPKNDFAPAWLKIPDSEGSKPPGGRNGDHDKSNRAGRRDDYYNYGRGYPIAPDYIYHPLQRQRSFDYYDERRYSPQKFRHHSVDDGYYNNGYPGPFPYFNGYDHYNAQSALGKYQHPNSHGNYGNGPVPVNGVFPPYFEAPYFDYYGDGYYGGGNYPGRPGNSGKRNHNDKSNGKSNGDKDSKNDSPSKGSLNSRQGSIEEEFPSLNGDSESTSGADKPRTNSNGVWEKPLNNKAKAKVNNVKLKAADQPREPAPSKQSVAMYKALVPKQASLNRKSGKDGLKFTPSKDNLSNGPSKVTPQFKSVKDANNKSYSGREVSSPTTSAPMEILNKQLVTQPKNLADKKSQFLKTLKSESPKSSPTAANKPHKANATTENNNISQDSDNESGIVNGVHKLSVESVLLSSSLEEEQRLLKQMGWSENDDDEYVITEEDMKEFQNLSEQMKEKRNGLKRTIPSSWSPQHRSIYQHPSLQLSADDQDDKLSDSSSDDSDLEDNKDV